MPRKWLQLMKYGKYNSYLYLTMWNHAKNLMKKLKRPNSLILQWEVSSSVLKTWKTRETKMRITQNFPILYPIQGTTMRKLRSWAFRKCGTFWVYDFLKGSYWLSKSSQIPKNKIAEGGVAKKQHSVKNAFSDPAWIGGVPHRVDYNSYSFQVRMIIINGVLFFCNAS